MSAEPARQPRPNEHAAGAAWITLSALCERGAFGDGPASARAAQRWRATLELGMWRKVGKSYEVHHHARLPAGQGRQSVESFLHVGAMPASFEGWELPDDFGEWTAKRQQRYRDMATLVLKVAEVKAKYLHKSERQVNEIVGVELGSWAEAHSGLATTQAAMKRYRSTLRNGKLARRGRPPGGADTMAPEAAQLFKNYYLDPRRWSIKACYETVAPEAGRQGWAWPSLKTVSRWVRRELPDVVADRFRLGVKRWERRYAPRIQRSVDHIRPGEHWDGDHHQFDFLVMHRGKPVRPWLTAWRDFRSRKFVGYHLCLSPNSDTILAAFRAAVREHGAPLAITIDNGRDYRAHGVTGGKRFKPRIDEEHVDSLMTLLGIEVHFTRPFEPQSKPIESAFGTVCERFSKTFASYCGGCPDKRPETLYADMRRGKVELHTLDQAREFFRQWSETFYHDKPHSGEGMHGRSPNEVFAQDDAIAKRTAPDGVLDALLTRTKKVKVTKNGIRYHGLFYGRWHDDLYPLFGQEVLLRIDPLDAGYVLVCDLKSGRFLLRADYDRNPGVTHEDVREAQKRRARRAKQINAMRGETSAYHRTLPQEIIEIQAEHIHAQSQMRQAAGGETAGPTPARNIELLPGADEMAPAALVTGRGRSTNERLSCPGDFLLAPEPVYEPAHVSMFTLDSTTRNDVGEPSAADQLRRMCDTDAPLFSEPGDEDDAQPDDSFADILIEERSDE